MALRTRSSTGCASYRTRWACRGSSWSRTSAGGSRSTRCSPRFASTRKKSLRVSGNDSRPDGLRASAAGGSPRVDEGPRPDGQEREERHEDVGARLTERERIGRGGSGGSPGQRHPEGEPDRPLHGLTVVELPDPREYSRQHQRDDLAPARGGSPLRKIVE